MGKTPFKMKGHALPGIKQDRNSPLKFHDGTSHGSFGWDPTGADAEPKPPKNPANTSPVGGGPSNLSNLSNFGSDIIGNIVGGGGGNNIYGGIIDAMSNFGSGGTPDTPTRPSAGNNQFFGGSACFIPETMITMADGTEKEISAIELGDVVKSEEGESTVKGIDIHVRDNVVYSINDSKHFVTADHPFKTVDGWKAIDPENSFKAHGIEADALKVGDTMITLDGEEDVVSIEAGDSVAKVYNLLLDNEHVYYADGYLVHNEKVDDGIDPPTPGSSGSAQNTPISRRRAPMRKDGWEGTGKDDGYDPEALADPGDDMGYSPVQNTPTSSRRAPMRHGPGGGVGVNTNMASLTGMPSSSIGPGGTGVTPGGTASGISGGIAGGNAGGNAGGSWGPGGPGAVFGGTLNNSGLGSGTSTSPDAGSGLINPFANMNNGQGPIAGNYGAEGNMEMFGQGGPVAGSPPQGQAMMQQMMQRRKGRNRFGSRRRR